MRLYDLPLSGNCHKIRMLLSMLGLEYEKMPINTMAGEQKTPEYLAINPLGKVPTLEDDGVIIRDSHAIAIYLARKYGGEDWLPSDAEGLGEVMQWVSYSANEIQHGPTLARALIKFKREGDLPGRQALANDVLAFMDAHLAAHDWLALSRPTIADLLCSPYIAMVWEGGVELAPYSNVQAWLDRIKALPGWIGMEGWE